MKLFWLPALVLVVATATACGDDDAPAPKPDASDTDAGSDDAGHRDAATHDASADAGHDAGPMSCGTLTARSAECDTCLHDGCCAELLDCSNDTGCTDLVTCIRDCDGDASTDCPGNCVLAHGFSPKYNGVVICMANQCAAECPFTSP